MISLRKAADRGATRIDRLDSCHTFSFGGYRDSRFTGFRDLLVINEDRVLPGAGFPTHPHRDMEIVSYVVAGALAHRDSLGTGSIIRPGEVQRMSAGTGIRHSEYNASQSEPVHFLQIWITPDRPGLPPGYEQVALPAADGSSRLDLIGGRTGGAQCWASTSGRARTWRCGGPTCSRARRWRYRSPLAGRHGCRWSPVAPASTDTRSQRATALPSPRRRR